MNWWGGVKEGRKGGREWVSGRFGARKELRVFELQQSSKVTIKWLQRE